eukprot:5185003-Pyramimonas_sp.AAC.1
MLADGALDGEPAPVLEERNCGMEVRRPIRVRLLWGAPHKAGRDLAGQRRAPLGARAGGPAPSEACRSRSGPRPPAQDPAPEP